MADLPLVLAGPIVRRCDRTYICFWICTSRDIRFTAELEYLLRQADTPAKWRKLEATVRQHTLRIAEQLFVSNLVARTNNVDFPVDSLIAYRLSIVEDSLGLNEELQLHQKTLLLEGADRLCFRLPFTQSADKTSLCYASCRNLSGEGVDVGPGIEAILAKKLSSIDRSEAPLVLVLGGDQIYADGMSPPLLRAIVSMSKALFGNAYAPLEPPTRRRELISNCGFTSKDNDHLVRFAEFVSTYLLTFSSAFQLIVSPIRDDDLRRRLARSRSWERVFANVPTYMMFDDHEVTDDWNIDHEWSAALKAPGRAIISAALLAYFLFQEWGNDPMSLDSGLITEIERLLKSPDTSEQIPKALERGRSFVIPADARILALDCRSTRERDTGWTWVREAFPMIAEVPIASRNHTLMVSPRELSRCKALIESTPGRREQPLVLLTNTPLFGRPLIESLQSVASRLTFSKNVVDAENWDIYPRSWIAVTDELLFGTDISACIIVSGDVHYSFTATATLSSPMGRSVKCLQITSSPACNQGAIVPGLITASDPPGEKVKAVWISHSARTFTTTGVMESGIAADSVISLISLALGKPFLKKWKTPSRWTEPNAAILENAFAMIDVHGSRIQSRFINSDARIVRSEDWNSAI
ncbi:MAG: alkaline phosphatase D family protein [Pseudomonadota bacterium]|nr:alkaline phosphatase D family protein [Pseudomonadota bacterium]